MKTWLFGVVQDFEQIFCSGQWFERGKSPCEVMEREQVEEFKALPACEVADDDLLAAAALLNIPRVSRCFYKPRGSWTK